MVSVFLLLALAQVLLGQASEQLPKWNSPTLFSDLLVNYDRSAVPVALAPTKVELGMYVNSLYGISQKYMEYSLSFYLRLKWTDPRLRYDPQKSGIKDTRAPHGYWDSIWTPDLFFRNEKSAKYIDIIAPQRLLKIKSSGEVWYVIKYAGTMSCPMKLQKFPFDTQTCPLMFESFGYTMDAMYYAWLDTPVDIDPDVRLPEFTLRDIILYDCSQNYTIGAFPCLEVRLVLKRDIGYYILQVFMPSILLVAMSWTQFWLEPSAVTGRVLVGLFCSFTLVAQMTGLRSSLPSISYMTSLDVWMGACLLFTASTLLQLILVAVCTKRQQRKCEAESGTVPERIDVISRICYPLLFVIFCVSYFCLMTISA